MSLSAGWWLVTSLPLVILLGVVAGRLLGVRRSWGTAITAGLVGWAAGAGVALVLARTHEGGAAGFSRNLWLFAAFFTMSATVWIELLAKPGALARARSQLGSVPHPLRAARRRGQRVSRYVEITRIAARHGLGRPLGIAEGDGEPRELEAPLALRLRRALEECGGMFVKLGQVASTRSDLLPPAVVQELARLQDQVALVDADSVRALLEEELDAPVERLFSRFDWQPIAAASIGQAHRAWLPDAQPVVVKVQRPGIADVVERDLQVLGALARTAEARAPWTADYHVVELVDEFAERLREELDFRIEARNMAEIGARLGSADGLTVPRVHSELSSSRVLVMDWLDGVSVRDVDAVGEDRARLADVLLRVLLRQILVSGHFHADPHPGNVLVLTDGRLGLIDFGATGRLDPIEQSCMTDMLIAVNQRDVALLRQAVLEIATVRPGFDDTRLERALARFMTRHLSPGAAPNAAMLNELLQLLYSFGIALPPEFGTLFRALVTLEGTLTSLSPGYLIIEAAQKLTADWARDRLTPGSLEELARKELIGLVPVLRRMPAHLDRIAAIVERGDLRARLSLFAAESDARLVTTLLNRVVLAFLGGVVGVISVILLTVPSGPEFTGTTSLYEFFGYFGLFCSAVLIMRVLVAILHDGLN